MNKTYLFSLVLLGLITLLAAFPALVLIAAFVTLGLAFFVAAFAPNAFVALLAFFPAATGALPKPVGLGIGVLLIALAALTPGTISQWRADADHAQAAAKDTLQANALAGRSITGIDFIRPGHLKLDPKTNLHPSDVCGQLCQRVLHGGQVDWIRVMITNRNGKVTQTAIVMRGEEDDCVSTLCFVYAKDTGQIADLTLVAEQNGMGRSEHRHQWRITQGPGGKGPMVFQQTETQLRVITRPAYLFPNIDRAWNGHDDFGFDISRRKVLYNPLNPEEIAKGLGLALASPKEGKTHTGLLHQPAPGPSATARIASLLDTTLEFSDRSETEIRTWMHGLKKVETLTDAQIDVAFQVLENQNLRFPPLTPLFVHKDLVEERLLPWAFDTLEQRPLFKPGQMSNVIGIFSSPVMDSALLAPYRDRYLALLDAPDVGLSKYNRDDRNLELWKAIGRFDFDPEPRLRERFGGAAFRIKSLMAAVCSSDPRWHETLTPLVRETIARAYEIRPGTRLSGSFEHALNFLFFTGHQDEVRAFVAATQWSNRDNLLKYSYSKEKPRRPKGNQICW